MTFLRIGRVCYLMSLCVHMHLVVHLQLSNFCADVWWNPSGTNMRVAFGVKTINIYIYVILYTYYTILYSFCLQHLCLHIWAPATLAGGRGCMSGSCTSEWRLVYMLQPPESRPATTLLIACMEHILTHLRTTYHSVPKIVLIL